MIILGIESSANVGSVALMKNGVLLGEYTLNNKKTHSQTLLPMVDALLTIADVDISEVDAIAVSAGPGSFTGLRIGSATAKGLAQAINKPIVSVSTIEGLAYNLSESDKLICPIMDARRQQVYTGIYSFATGQMTEVLEPSALPIEELIDKINALGKETIFVGDGVYVFQEYIDANATIKIGYASAGNMLQRASSIATIGAIKFQKGETETAASHAPIYLRVSQAERELMEKQGKA